MLVTWIELIKVGSTSGLESKPLMNSGMISSDCMACLTTSATIALLSGESGRVKFSRVQRKVGVGWTKGSVKTVISGVEITWRFTKKVVASWDNPEIRKCQGGGLRSVVKVLSCCGVLMTRFVDASFPTTRWISVLSFDQVASASCSNLALQGLTQALGPGLFIQAVRSVSSRPSVTGSQIWGTGNPFGGCGVISKRGEASCVGGTCGVASVGAAGGVIFGVGGGGIEGWGGASIVEGEVMVQRVVRGSWSGGGSWERFCGRGVSG